MKQLQKATKQQNYEDLFMKVNKGHEIVPFIYLIFS